MRKNTSLEETIRIIQKKYKNVPSPLSEQKNNQIQKQSPSFEPPFKKALK